MCVCACVCVCVRACVCVCVCVCVRVCVRVGGHYASLLFISQARRERSPELWTWTVGATSVRMLADSFGISRARVGRDDVAVI